MLKPVCKADLSLDPLIVIRGGAAQAGVKKLMAATGDIDRDRKSLLARSFYELAADLPGNLFIEAHELKLVFLLKQLLQYVFHVTIP
jgi:hypothetical protein